jgi:hypothetical protein
VNDALRPGQKSGLLSELQRTGQTRLRRTFGGNAGFYITFSLWVFAMKRQKMPSAAKVPRQFVPPGNIRAVFYNLQRPSED